MQFWLKMVGTGEAPLPNRWLGSVAGDPDSRELLERVWFPTNKKPTGVDAGDRLVYYAAGARRFFAVVEVVSDEPYEAAESSRWPWALDVRPLLLVGLIDAAPSLAVLELRRGTLSVRHQSHIRLTHSQYATAVDRLAAVAL